MTNPKIEFFKAEDFKDIVNFPDNKLVAQEANRILTERGVRVSGSKIDGGLWVASEEPSPHDTHTMLLVDSQPIRKEPVVFESFVMGTMVGTGQMVEEKLSPFKGKKVKVTVEEIVNE